MAPESPVAALEDVAEEHIELIEAGARLVVDIAVVDLEDELVDGLVLDPVRENLAVVGRVALEARGHLGLGVEALVAQVGGE